MKIYQKQAILQEVAVYTTYLFEKLGFDRIDIDECKTTSFNRCFRYFLQIM